MKNLPKKLANKIKERQKADSVRILSNYSFPIDFASNDYLGVVYNGLGQGYVRSEAQQNNSGATGSRLLTGNHQAYTVLETKLAELFKVDGALVFNSGYAANLGLLSAVPRKGDLVLYDQLAHASIRDGIALSQAKAYKFEHNDLSHLEALIARHQEHFDHIYVVTESVFSMDGDSPNLESLCNLCQQKGIYLIVDEAHALGIFGKHGEGLVQELGLQGQVFARIVTFGKAIGAHGAAVLTSDELKQYLVNFARSLIYTTALPSWQVYDLIERFNWIQNSKEFSRCQAKLKEHIRYFKQQVEILNLSSFFTSGEAAIHCLQLPGNSNVKLLSAQIQAKGIGVLPIMAPTVPKGQERIRICLHTHNTQAQIRQLLELLANHIASSTSQK